LDLQDGESGVGKKKKRGKAAKKGAGLQAAKRATKKASDFVDEIEMS
jgi:hypothetical protein